MATAKRAPKVKSSGVRFSEEAASSSHVHFDDKLHDSVVMVMPVPDGSFLVKVGFLLHKPCTCLPVSLKQDRCSECVSLLPTGGHRITCEYMAHQEGVMKEEVFLTSETSENACVKVTVQARVMDRHHGTPMLLEGVRCIGAELEYDSEQSDWQGFD
ncbi:UPF0687 protein C20orf27 homolog [Polyodon spathula]|uniref:UPF0687 protein C20orf27 homolog n=1 Tax=Polyodon spathula TaxID=7913 RepID=UPI001B7DA470|nr:UPF0687 protein C20orf27 homolog [Polyodon spathula]